MIITNLSISDRYLEIQWDESHQSRFDLFWLRDNCTCFQCGNRAQGQKRVSMLELPEHPKISDLQKNGDSLSITWSNDNHQSLYDNKWLLTHCYCDQCRSNREYKPHLWDSGIKPPTFGYQELMDDELNVQALLSEFLSKGFVFVQGIPTNEQGFETLLSKVGYIKETNYGRVCDLKVTTEGRLLGDTNAPIPLHTDECYRHANPGILAFQCLSTSEDGGGTNLLADGFHLAEILRTKYPESFKLLSSIPMTSRRYHHHEADLRSSTPVLSVDFEGNIQGIRYNERSAAPLDLPEHLTTPAYEALREWLKLTRDQRFQVRINMTPGDAIIFDNQRVLHGRDEFNGKRHLLYAQLDLDEPHSRARTLSQKLLGIDDVNYTHRGT